MLKHEIGDLAGSNGASGRLCDCTTRRVDIVAEVGASVSLIQRLLLRLLSGVFEVQIADLAGLYPVSTFLPASVLDSVKGWQEDRIAHRLLAAAVQGWLRLPVNTG